MKLSPFYTVLNAQELIVILERKKIKNRKMPKVLERLRIGSDQDPWFLNVGPDTDPFVVGNRSI